MIQKNSNKNAKYKNALQIVIKKISEYLIICAISFILFILVAPKYLSNNSKNAYILSVAKELNSVIKSSKRSIQILYNLQQTGNLNDIIQCSSMTNTNTANQQFEQTIIQIKNKNLNEDSKKQYPICGDTLSLQIASIEDFDVESKIYKHFSLKVGEEARELLQEFPFIHYAILNTPIGEEATFITVPNLHDAESVYRIKTSEAENRSTPFSIIKNNNKTVSVRDFVSCGSRVLINYKIYNSKNELIDTGNNFQINLNNNHIPPIIEHTLLRTKAKEEVIILLLPGDIDSIKKRATNQRAFFTHDILAANSMLIVNITVKSIIR